MFKTILTSALIACLMNLFFFSLVKPPTIATVNIAAITEQFIKVEAKKNLSLQDKQIAIKQFSSSLENAL